MKITVSDSLATGIATNDEDFGFNNIDENFDRYEDLDSGGFITYYDITGSDYLSSVSYEFLSDDSYPIELIWYSGDTTVITMSDIDLDEEPASIEEFLIGNDDITGNKFRDTLFSYSGKDSLNGMGGNDNLNGGAGKDSLTGGSGKDSLTGGIGNDLFVFKATAESSDSAKTSDIITDYSTLSDRIDLSAIDAFASTSKNDTFVWKGPKAFNSATQGEVRYEKFNNSGTDNDYTMVWIDVDHGTGVEMAIRLAGLHNLTDSDFIL